MDHRTNDRHQPNAHERIELLGAEVTAVIRHTEFTMRTAAFLTQQRRRFAALPPALRADLSAEVHRSPMRPRGRMRPVSRHWFGLERHDA